MRHAVLAGVSLALAGSVLTAGPAPAAGAKDATLTWKISECAFTACPSLTQAQSVTGNATSTDDGWRFSGGTGTYDAGTGATQVSFAASLTIGNTGMGGTRSPSGIRSSASMLPVRVGCRPTSPTARRAAVPRWSSRT